MPLPRPARPQPPEGPQPPRPAAGGLSPGRLAAALAAWIALAGPGFAAPPAHERGGVLAADVRLGRQLLGQYQCGSCHEIPGVPAARGRHGPSLAQFGRRAYIAGHIPNRPALLTRWIAEPQALVPGTAMPDMGVSADDARHMAAYLGGLR